MANYQVSRPPEKKAAYRFRIVVTHYINPQLFWYYIDVPDSLHKVLEVESLLLAECTRDSGQCYFRPHLNEIVAVQYLPFSKYIRGQVLHVDNESEKPTYILWAIDHGFPFASDGRYLWQIPVDLRKPSDRIICGGMANIYPKPSVPITDDVNLHHIISEMSWSDDACEFIEWLMKNARYLFFYHLHLSENRKQWGFLNIRFQNEVRRRSYKSFHAPLGKSNADAYLNLCGKILKGVKIVNTIEGVIFFSYGPLFDLEEILFCGRLQ
ncbi:putative ATP-dependent RNA helicase SoYb [Teleopsis dalmanni]|uniref:putative ATP-dependent RNA helicase SoYb n=1 Tax=Teleopsis dalmanni TaxID=139649 RepID=UPI0018CCDAB7|nr:putative ATP-dependent RNA helicase SoYb [Teleopsis dalmanni]